ncbi:MAG: aldo/keto reductase [Planctomycetota bacterium]|nr:aldo/keto reductase [Planctomycetota bacterium]
MRNRSIAGREVSEIGLGCWQIGADWGEIDHETALDVLRTAHANGVTLFDTADIYGAGRSEQLVGEFLTTLDTPVFVATKLGRAASPGWPQNFTESVMRSHVEGSLERLGVEQIDLLQLHCVPTEVLQDGAIFDHLRGLRESGLIRAFGASIESIDQALICLEQDGLESLQLIFNLLRHDPRDQVFDAAAARGVGLIIRLPLASGLLSGCYQADTTFAADDHRTYNRNGEAFNVGETFSGLPFEQGLQIVETLRPLVPDSMTMAQFAQRWILDHPAVSSVITGVSRPEQARRNAEVSDLPALSDGLHAELSRIYDSQVRSQIRGPV